MTADRSEISGANQPGPRAPGIKLLGCRLCRRVGAALLVAILVVEIAGLFYSLHSLREARIAALADNGRAALTLMLKGARGPEWAVTSLSELDLRAEGLQGLTLFAGGQNLISVGKGPATPLAADGQWVPLAEGGLDIMVAVPGTADLSLAARLRTDRVDAEVRDAAIRAVVVMVVLTAVVLVVCGWAMSRSVLGPVLAFRRHIETAEEAALRGEVHPIPGQRNDELGDVFAAFNTLQGRLADAISELQGHRASLTQAKEGLEQQLQVSESELTEAQQALKREMADRLKAQSRLAQQDSHLAGTGPDASPDPVLKISMADFTLSYANPAAEPLLAEWNVQVGSNLPEPWNGLLHDIGRGSTAGDVELDCGGVTYAIYFQAEPDTDSIDMIGRNISEQRAAEERIRQLANIDTLTGLPNRALFHDRLEQVLRQAKRSKAVAAVHLIDVDHFKDVNDTLGHSRGDALLREIAGRLEACVRDSDTVARLGGDEFAIIQVGTNDANGASILAQKVLDTFKAPFEIDGQIIHSDASIGVTLFPEEAVGSEQVLRNADMALYRAKGDGRGTYRFFISDMNEEIQRFKEIESDMRDALEAGNQFMLYYQPKLDMKKGRVSGMEALIRWQHPEKGFLSPGEFIPVAEKSKLIVQIGAWSLEAACHQTCVWRDQGLGDLKVAVNLSSMQFRERDLVEQVKKVLDDTGLSPAQLELEITESVAMDDAEAAIKVFKDLRALGVSLSIDDFGTGYSSLSYLKNFPVKRVKIDKAFVDDIDPGADDGIGGNGGAIARAVTQLGHSFGMEVTAE
ncbi:MAG: putative bifunctional diguanylate cyclase/phosphodiesterase, partial [Rhodospirillales bacterium]